MERFGALHPAKCAHCDHDFQATLKSLINGTQCPSCGKMMHVEFCMPELTSTPSQSARPVAPRGCR